MKVGEEIIVGRMGQHPMHIIDQSVAPEHARLRRLSSDIYQIEETSNDQKIIVCGLRVKRKNILESTPLLLGGYKTSVKDLFVSLESLDLQEVWDNYEQEKRKWDRYTNMVNSIRMLTPIATMALTQVIAQTWLASVVVLVIISAIAIVVGDKVLSRKNQIIAELNNKMQSDYVCPHCHRFLSFTPYNYLKSKRYCPNPACGYPLP